MATRNDTTPGELQRVLGLALERCLGLRPDDELLVLAERSRADLADLLRAEGERLGARVSVMVAALRSAFEPPACAAAALAACDVFVALTDGSSISHTAARADASAAGARGAGIGGDGDVDDLLRRLLGADLDAVAARSDRLAAALTSAETATIRCPRGTDLQLDLRGAAATSDNGDLRASGAYGNLPFGEAFCVPVGGDGQLVPATVAGMGRLAPDTRLELAGGALADVAGADGRALLERLCAHGPAGLNVAELGVGTNDRARISGAVLEDEKVLGTVHVAFGASAGIGGTVSAGIHLDCVVPDATLLLDDRPVLRDGALVLA